MINILVILLTIQPGFLMACNEDFEKDVFSKFLSKEHCNKTFCEPGILVNNVHDRHLCSKNWCFLINKLFIKFTNTNTNRGEYLTIEFLFNSTIYSGYITPHSSEILPEPSKFSLKKLYERSVKFQLNFQSK